MPEHVVSIRAGTAVWVNLEAHEPTDGVSGEQICNALMPNCCITAAISDEAFACPVVDGNLKSRLGCDRWTRTRRITTSRFDG